MANICTSLGSDISPPAFSVFYLHYQHSHYPFINIINISAAYEKKYNILEFLFMISNIFILPIKSLESSVMFLKKSLMFTKTALIWSKIQ